MNRMRIMGLMALATGLLAVTAGCGGNDDDADSGAAGSGAAEGGSGGEQTGGASGSTGEAGSAGAAGEGAGGSSTAAGGGAGGGSALPGAGGAAGASLDILGEYADDYGTSHVITNETWAQSSSFGDSTFNITRFSNHDEYLIAQNDASNDYNPELWSRFDWVVDGGELWFCQSTYDAPTELDALETARADDTDPSTGGCGEFAWSRLTAADGQGEAGAGGAGAGGRT